MSVPVLTLFNNRGGVGATSLVYHLAWMFASLGKRTLAVDIDPQADLTAAFLSEDRITGLWESADPGATVYQCVKLLLETGDIAEPSPYRISEDLCILPGDIRLSNCEDMFWDMWSRSLTDSDLHRPMRILSSFRQIMDTAAQQMEADIVLADIGPNLGAINRSALIATDYVMIPLGADLISLQNLENLGRVLQRWEKDWTDRLENWRKRGEASGHPDFRLPPEDIMRPIGYFCQQPGMIFSRHVSAYNERVDRIPAVYRESVLKSPESVLQEQPALPARPENDPHCLGVIGHYYSLRSMGREKRKPIFELKPADGALGGHAEAARCARDDFHKLARKIAGRIKMPLEETYNSVWEGTEPELLR